jgi:hypothetical protein
MPIQKILVVEYDLLQIFTLYAFKLMGLIAIKVTLTLARQRVG